MAIGTNTAINKRTTSKNNRDTNRKKAVKGCRQLCNKVPKEARKDKEKWLKQEDRNKHDGGWM